MTDPVLKNWRLVGEIVLVGEVSGHPLLEDGWITTSEVIEISEEWAQTASRRYRLVEPLPDDQPLPPAGRDAVLARLLRGCGVVASGELARLNAVADELSAAPSSNEFNRR